MIDFFLVYSILVNDFSKYSEFLLYFLEIDFGIVWFMS